jgi:hypothetical protein
LLFNKHGMVFAFYFGPRRVEVIQWRIAPA